MSNENKNLRITIARLREHLIYDPDAGRFFLKSDGKEVGHDKGKGYIGLMIDRVQLRAHRVAWAMYYGEWPQGQIDHINRNPSDNRIENLRVATPSQSAANSTMKNNRYGARGVSISRGKYRATMMHHGEYFHIGTFETLDEAAHAYNKAAIAKRGEFAILNPIGADYER